jgi:hypothetical protein
LYQPLYKDENTKSEELKALEAIQTPPCMKEIFGELPSRAAKRPHAKQKPDSSNRRAAQLQIRL